MAADGEATEKTLAFTDEEFEQAAKEVANPDLTDFEFFVESHGTKIYRHYKEVSFQTIVCS